MSEYLSKKAVLEWKLAMADYRDTVGEYRQMARQTLEELAGLKEEPNHDT